MYFFKSVNFSDNMYEIAKGNDEFYASVDCTLKELHQRDNKRFIDVQFEGDFIDQIKALERSVEEHFNVSLQNKLVDNSLKCKIPCAYNRMSIPIVNTAEQRLTSSELIPSTRCTIHLLAKYLYTHSHTGGIVWTIKKIKII